ncbi:CubicO group peptidase, beta-lactamase class C family [Nocardia amikacinitolerans]|uniref:serine hydrolase domain-containing protein n=1 Tax=Nocardia amikacinitolerans TaxID=756689 RepID=UPI0020A57DDF|nr:serine hydrolase domain-containing protein [Nocardia amikacinitolerans]MCP2294253.1 CubicO group peptidase, beta-lactamase class C family [Nocardia amikacinitolerans]
MSDVTLSEFVEAAATKYGIPGLAVGVLVDGREVFACHGVTSLDDPQPVDSDTLFQLSSITKTFTATALLVAEGRVELDAPVREYVPELALADEDAANTITVANLLNHTAGLDWNLAVDTGDGEDALAEFVARLPELGLIAAPGERASYSQAGYNLAGRIVEKVTGQSFEQAVAELVFAPIGLSHSSFAEHEITARRFAEGHNAEEDGSLTVARQWRPSRANNPGGGLASSAADQLRWARFHLGDGGAVLPAESLLAMRRPTVALRASSFGDAIGIGWFLRDIDGVRAIGHGGSGNGQFAELLIVPERDFAIVVMSNAGPEGIACNQAIVRWALEHYLNVLDRDAEPLPYDATRAAELAGTYDIDAMTLVIAADATGLSLAVGIKPEIRAASDQEMPPDYPAAAIGLLPGDEYIVTDGGLRGQLGYFSRDEHGRIVGVDLAGRLFRRVAA